MRRGRRALAMLLAVLCAVSAVGCAVAEPPAREPLPLSEAISNSGEIVAAIRAGLREHAGSITISFDYHADILDELGTLTDEWVEAALAETDDPTEGDYIRYQYGGYERSCRYEAENGRYRYTVELVPDYYLYDAQEQEVSAKLDEVYTELDLAERASDYEKLRAIYNYICSHVRYDKVHRKNEYHHEKSTAYAALLRGTATCQGYAVLLYRMLRENGIDCRVITGTGTDDTGEQLHAWNIAALDGRYYYLDATWDAGAEEFRFFLRGSKGFENHVVGTDFTSDAFLERYPMASGDYRE